MAYKYGIQEVHMTTARDRYEAKTKVVTFRVRNEEFQQLEEIKSKTGLSNADLIKLGAGIAGKEIKAKLVEAGGLEDRLAQLKAALRQAQQELDRTLAEEKKQRLAELDTEMKAFKLFDQGWALENVSFKMGISHETAYRYFQEWGEAGNDKKAVERELLRECLRKHIAALKDQRAACSLFSRHSGELARMAEEIDYCQHLLDAPSDINGRWKAFLLAEYSRQIQLADKKET
jgi:hypothetical protein